MCILSLLFSNNSGDHGTAIYLDQGAYVELEQNAIIQFANNSITQNWGVIFIDMECEVELLQQYQCYTIKQLKQDLLVICYILIM